MDQHRNAQRAPRGRTGMLKRFATIAATAVLTLGLASAAMAQDATADRGGGARSGRRSVLVGGQERRRRRRRRSWASRSSTTRRRPSTWCEMAQLIDAAVASKPDGLVVSIPDADALGDSIKNAVAAGIPVISINSGTDVREELGVAGPCRPDRVRGRRGRRREDEGGRRHQGGLRQPGGRQRRARRALRGLRQGARRRRPGGRRSPWTRPRSRAPSRRQFAAQLRHRRRAGARARRRPSRRSPRSRSSACWARSRSAPSTCRRACWRRSPTARWCSPSTSSSTCRATCRSCCSTSTSKYGMMPAGT